MHQPADDQQAYIEQERRDLQALVDNIDDTLADYRALLEGFSERDADYSVESLRAVEDMLLYYKPSFEDDLPLLNESALYLGETLRRSFDAEWDICADADNYPEQFGKPMITGHSSYGDFYPFEEIQRFLSAPAQGYFAKSIAEQVNP